MSSLLLSMFCLWDASPQSSLESRSLTAGSKGALISSQSITRSQPLSYVDQLNRILHYLGTPSEDTLHSVGPPRAQEYTRSLPIKPRVPFSTPVPHANPLAIDLSRGRSTWILRNELPAKRPRTIPTFRFGMTRGRTSLSGQVRRRL